MLNLRDVAKLYQDKSGEWLLLEVLETDTRKNPVRLKLLAHSRDKSQLHEFIAEDEDWNWQKQYLIVLADPAKPCTIGPQFTDSIRRPTRGGKQK